MKLFAVVLLPGLLSAGAAFAADPGPACCSDLEERVAELEAASARKGNRAVSLTVSGEVNKALLIWDDGRQSDAYVVDNAGADQESRLNVSGEGTVGAGWRTGFVIELGFTDSSSLFVNQANDEGPGDTAFETRLANWYIEGERFGRVTLGQQSSATDGITTIDLSRAKTDAVTWHNKSFGIRSEDGGYTGLTWGNVAWGLEGDRGDFIRYDSPVLYGFMASAAWGEDDSWDAALRFQKELDSVRIAAGAGYLYVGDATNASLYPNETKIASGSVSVMHMPTGLFGNLAAGRVELSDKALAGPDNPDDGTMWMAQAGIEKRVMPFGATTLYGEYGEYGDILLGYSAFSPGSTPTIAAEGITGTEVSRWGVGAVQQFDAAALEMYAVFNHFDAEIRTAESGNAATEPWYGVVVGSRLKF
ncbi:porin [Rhodomicrobium vannielii]|nr:porin [Rhodomicrobium vannielii]